MTNIIKVLDHKTIALKKDDKTVFLTKRVSTLGLKKWYNIKGEVYA